MHDHDDITGSWMQRTVLRLLAMLAGVVVALLLMSARADATDAVALPPIVDDVVPVVDDVAPNVAPVVDPVVADVSAVLEGVGTNAGSVVAPAADIAVPVLQPIVEIVVPVITPVVDQIAPVVGPVVDVLDPVVELLDPLVDLVDPVVGPILDPAIDILDPVVGPSVDPATDLVPKIHALRPLTGLRISLAAVVAPASTLVERAATSVPVASDVGRNARAVLGVLPIAMPSSALSSGSAAPFTSSLSLGVLSSAAALAAVMWWLLRARPIVWTPALLGSRLERPG